MTQEVAYLLERSSVEAVRAIESLDGRAADKHRELCRLYVGRVLAAMPGWSGAPPSAASSVSAA